MRKVYIILIGLIGLVMIYFVVGFIKGTYFKIDPNVISDNTDSTWVAPSLSFDHTTTGEERELVIYGEELIAHTSRYLGPKGSVAKLTNGMNCQNCHLQAGKKAWGNNYAAVFSTYPKFRDRSGQIESIYKRVADCMERSLNGKAVDSNSREFKAIYAYIKWLGKDVAKNNKPHGAGIEKISFLDRAADPLKGKLVYTSQCQSCHGANGEGMMAPDEKEYAYPPLWGANSYNDGAGLFRISNFAGYVKNNMPYQLTSHQNPTLTIEECVNQIKSYIYAKSTSSRE